MRYRRSNNSRKSAIIVGGAGVLSLVLGGCGQAPSQSADDSGAGRQAQADDPTLAHRLSPDYHWSSDFILKAAQGQYRGKGTKKASDYVCGWNEANAAPQPKPGSGHDWPWYKKFQPPLPDTDGESKWRPLAMAVRTDDSAVRNPDGTPLSVDVGMNLTHWRESSGALGLRGAALPCTSSMERTKDTAAAPNPDMYVAVFKELRDYWTPPDQQFSAAMNVGSTTLSQPITGGYNVLANDDIKYGGNCAQGAQTTVACAVTEADPAVDLTYNGQTYKTRTAMLGALLWNLPVGIEIVNHTPQAITIPSDDDAKVGWQRHATGMKLADTKREVLAASGQTAGGTATIGGYRFMNQKYTNIDTGGGAQAQRGQHVSSKPIGSAQSDRPSDWSWSKSDSQKMLRNMTDAITLYDDGSFSLKIPMAVSSTAKGAGDCITKPNAPIHQCGKITLTLNFNGSKKVASASCQLEGKASLAGLGIESISWDSNMQQRESKGPDGLAKLRIAIAGTGDCRETKAI